jgi:hypothetical protein
VQWRVLACACAGSLGVLAGFAGPLRADSVDPTTCTDISEIPVQKPLTYGAAIQSGIFHNFDGNGNGCDQCHTAFGQFPDLSDEDLPSPYQNIVDVPSPDFTGEIYVIPNHPEQSLLFKKINCDNPGSGARMPLNNAFGGLTAYQQALVYDWIAAGAPPGTTDVVFRSTFDIRGFFIDGIFRDGFE